MSDLGSVGPLSYTDLSVDTFYSVIPLKIIFIRDITELLRQAIKYWEAVVVTVRSTHFPRF